LKTTIKNVKFDTHKPICQDFIKTHSTESRCVTGPENTLFAGIFQTENFTGWGSEGVKAKGSKRVLC